ncbi:MAG: ester cyclase [Leptolyngbyaceae cyanobacterium bins.302]|nr:ester cyclase [Leptolyngbyaceae cyanobacterium bins.302]
MFGAFKDISRILNTDVGDLLFRKTKVSSELIIDHYGVNSPEAKLAIARRYYEEILNDAKLEVCDELMSQDFMFTIPTHPDPYYGPDGFKNLVTMLHGAFPDVHLKVEHLLVDGDTVVGHWTGSGTHTGGPLHTVKGDIPASGKGFVIDGVSWLKIVDGKIVESLANEDTLSLLKQIGVIPVPPNGSAAESNKDVAKRYFNEILNSGNLDAIPEIIAPEFVLHFPLFPRPIRGQDALKHFVTTLRTAFPDIHYDVDREAGDQDKAAIRWKLSGTHQGEYLGIPPRNTPVTLQGVSIFRLNDGQILEAWVNENDLGLLEQIRPPEA